VLFRSDERPDEDRNGRRRRRGRRGGRGRGREEGYERSERLNGEPHEPFAAASDVAAEASLELTADERSGSPDEPRRSEPAGFEAPREPAAEPIRTASFVPDEQAAPEAAPPSEPEPEPVAVVLTPPDPDRPKRAGWWSRAKSVLSGS